MFQVLVQVAKRAAIPLQRSAVFGLPGKTTRAITVGQKNAPEKPRRAPLSAYQLFVKERINEIQGSEPDEKPRERFKKIAAEWSDLSQEKKNIYRARSDSEKDEWMRNCAKYEAFLDSLSEVERNRMKIKELLLKAGAKERRQITKQSADDIAEKMPKRPGSAFQLYFQEELERGGFRGLKGPELFKAASEKWKALSDFDKQRFKTQRKQMHNEYLEQLEIWKKS